MKAVECTVGRNEGCGKYMDDLKLKVGRGEEGKKVLYIRKEEGRKYEHKLSLSSSFIIAVRKQITLGGGSTVVEVE